MVLGRLHHVDVLVVHECEHGNLRPAQHLFDHNALARAAERFLPHDLIDRLDRIGGSIGDGDALPLREPRRLDDDRALMLADIFFRGGRIGERSRLRRRHRLLAHQFLGEPFVRFDLRRIFRRPEDFQALRDQMIRQPRRQRIFRTDHDEVDVVLFRRLGDGFEIHRIARQQVGDLRDPRIPRHRI
jgi:hypothetical protein